MEKPIKFKGLPFLLFWIFSSIPRILFLWQSPQPDSHSFSVFLSIVFVGFLKDGFLIAGLLIVAIPIQKLLIKKNPQSGPRITFLSFSILTSFLLGFMILDTQYMIYFNSHANLDHLSFLRPTADGLSLFLTSGFEWKRFAVLLFGLPFLFFILEKNLFRDSFNAPNSKRVKILFLCALGGGIVGVMFSFDRPFKNMVSDNVISSAAKNIIFGDELRPTSNSSIEPLIDSRTPWVYFDGHYPLAKATPHHLCQMGKWDNEKCLNQDQDKDGHPLKEDCNDKDPLIHPKTIDIPNNGIDEDCSGLDKNPPNILLIHWEGVRSVDVGSLGATPSATPNFDRFAKQGKLFSNAYANGVQTRYSLISLYASILPRLSSKWIFKDNFNLHLQSFPSILRTKGFETIYFHGSWINYSHKDSRFTDWFETKIDRSHPWIKNQPQFNWGLTDKDLFELAFQYLKNRKDPRPFYMTLATLSNHFPYDLPDKKFEKKPHQIKKNQVPNLTSYSDYYLGQFLEKMRNDPQFQNTIILITSDHGLNRFAPHPTGTQDQLWEDLVWVPILLIGNKWKTEPGIDSTVRQLADIGPTILDQLGIEVPNHFIGRSLLKPIDQNHRKVFFGTANGGLTAGLRFQNEKYLVRFDANKEWLFDIGSDREEKENLVMEDSYQEKKARYFDWVRNVYGENTRLIHENRIWNPTFEFLSSHSQ